MLLLLLFDARHDVTKWRRHAVEFVSLSGRHAAPATETSDWIRLTR